MTILLILGAVQLEVCAGAATQARYFGHAAVEDRHGVIAPWYQGSNGPFDERIRIAVETLRRYPWIGPPRSSVSVPEYLFSSYWSIAPDGAIRALPLDDWMNGDRGQLASYVLYVMPEYYRYSGDPMAVAHASLEADLLLRFGLTPADHPWPRFPISVPTKGKPYGQCDPHGFIQLDIVGRAGWGLLRTYQLTGERRYFDAAKHWADVLAAKRNREPGADPWGRYANPEDVPWKSNKLTGGIVWILEFLDEVIRLGYTGTDGSVVAARDTARTYLTDHLLPAWSVNDTWGRQYWDWECPVQVGNITSYVARYLMEHKDLFPNWRVDARNILSLYLNRSCVNPSSNGDVYSGAWAYPESCSCCGRCLSAGPLLTLIAWARYAAESGSEWALEMARRQAILMTYDAHDTGVSEDNIDGGVITNGKWFESAHMAPLTAMLGAMAWLPYLLAPSGENHIVRSTAVVNDVAYGKGRVAYSTFDAPAETIDVLRLAYKPSRVTAGGQRLGRLRGLAGNGYTLRALKGGDWLVSVRHDGATRVVVEGPDTQEIADDARLAYTGTWRRVDAGAGCPSPCHVADSAGASASWRFHGTQVRVVGSAGPRGGLADVYLDGVKQLAGLDFWCPQRRSGQVLYRRSGLANGPHAIRVIARGAHNPEADGSRVTLEAVQWSRTASAPATGEGGGPTGAQRLLFGYTGRSDWVDSAGNAWRPACEFVVRSGAGTDSVAAAWWKDAAPGGIAGTPDPELYRYGVHAPEFWVNLTVGPGRYRLRLCFAATRGIDTLGNRVTVKVNGREVAARVDVAARAGGPNRAYDLFVDDVTPAHGIIEVRFIGGAAGSAAKGEAFVQAIELTPAAGNQARKSR